MTNLLKNLIRLSILSLLLLVTACGSSAPVAGLEGNESSNLYIGTFIGYTDILGRDSVNGQLPIVDRFSLTLTIEEGDFPDTLQATAIKEGETFRNLICVERLNVEGVEELQCSNTVGNTFGIYFYLTLEGSGLKGSHSHLVTGPRYERGVVSLQRK